jgi:molybdopterin/thiamine biosynthesis adenylyltransferase
VRRISVNKNWRLLILNKKTYLINIVNSTQLLLDSSKRETIYLFSLLNRKLTVNQIKKLFYHRFPKFEKGWVDSYLNLLFKKNIITYAKKKPAELSDRYLLGLDRQLDFLSEINNGKTNYENQLALKQSKIAVLGLGSVAHYIIMALVASGIGSFICVDFDTKEDRNIGRQPIFRPEDIGKTKAEVVGDFIKASRPETRVTTINKKLESKEDVSRVIKDCDVVVHCCDLPRFLIHRWINSSCLELKKPNLLVYSGRVGPFSIPYKTSCYGCLETAMRKKFVLYDSLVENIISGEFTRFPELAVVGCLSGVLAAKEIIAYILDIPPQTINAFIDINPFSLKITLHKLPRQANCYACSKKE